MFALDTLIIEYMSLLVPFLTYFDFMQFDQKVGRYHLTGTDIVITKSDFLPSQHIT